MTDAELSKALEVEAERDNLRIEVNFLAKQNKKLRDALAPFGCLGRNELTQGDFNHARRTLQATTEPPKP